MRWPGSLPSQRRPPLLLPTPSPRPRGVTAEASALLPQAERRGNPGPVLQKGRGQTQGPVGGKASWKEALVRHGVAGQTGWPPIVLSASPTESAEQLGEGKGEERPEGNHPLLLPRMQGAGSIHKEPYPLIPPVPGHYCFSDPNGVGQGELLSPDPWGPATGCGRWHGCCPLGGRPTGGSFIQKQQCSQAACEVPWPEIQAGPGDPCFTLAGACVD